LYKSECNLDFFGKSTGRLHKGCRFLLPAFHFLHIFSLKLPLCNLKLLAFGQPFTVSYAQPGLLMTVCLWISLEITPILCIIIKAAGNLERNRKNNQGRK
jgi:hypothetical protein